jgi:hypothetical protein
MLQGLDMISDGACSSCVRPLVKTCAALRLCPPEQPQSCTPCYMEGVLHMLTVQYWSCLPGQDAKQGVQQKFCKMLML